MTHVGPLPPPPVPARGRCDPGQWPSSLTPPPPSLSPPRAHCRGEVSASIKLRQYLNFIAVTIGDLHKKILPQAHKAPWILPWAHKDPWILPWAHKDPQILPWAHKDSPHGSCLELTRPMDLALSSQGHRSCLELTIKDQARSVFLWAPDKICGTLGAPGKIRGSWSWAQGKICVFVSSRQDLCLCELKARFVSLCELKARSVSLWAQGKIRGFLWAQGKIASRYNTLLRLQCTLLIFLYDWKHQLSIQIRGLYEGDMTQKSKKNMAGIRIIKHQDQQDSYTGHHGAHGQRPILLHIASVKLNKL